MIDLDVIDAATAPEVPWRPWMVAALLGVRVARVPMVDGLSGVSLRDPAIVYLRPDMGPSEEAYILTRSILALCRDWPDELIDAEAAFLMAPRLTERGAA